MCVCGGGHAWVIETCVVWGCGCVCVGWGACMGDRDLCKCVCCVGGGCVCVWGGGHAWVIETCVSVCVVGV